MKTTYFKPSIHGWPFGNNWSYTLPLPLLNITINHLGFCGGMCWSALDRFFNGESIPRDTIAPAEGDPLYNDIGGEQLASLDVIKVLKMFEWQQSPKLSGHFGNIHKSLGEKTLNEWPLVKNHIDRSKPITLTLIRKSNNYNPGELVNIHRVIAYAYETRRLEVNEYVHGTRHASTRKVKLFIYDPNHKNDDNVYLTFYTNCDDDWIHLEHNKPNTKASGFFMDDKPRNLSSTRKSIHINSCVKVGIDSPNLANYDLTFSWTCNFIPYFCIQINDINWENNDDIKSSLLPADKDNKQCPNNSGRITINLKLPRVPYTVTVRFLDSDSYKSSVSIDPISTIYCMPYIRDRIIGGPEINEGAIVEDDLFIEDENPSETEITQLQEDASRNVFVKFADGAPPLAFLWDDINYDQLIFDIIKRNIFGRGPSSISKTCFGNIKVPIRAMFRVKNLTAPFYINGFVYITKNGVTIETKTLDTLHIDDLSTLENQHVEIFNGFEDTITDYADDTKVRFAYHAKDVFDETASGETVFYGKSVIKCTQALPSWHFNTPILKKLFDGPEIYEFRDILIDLIQKNLLGYIIQLRQSSSRVRITGSSYLVSNPIDYSLLKTRIHSDHNLKKVINRTFSKLWKNSDIWLDASKQIDKEMAVLEKERIRVFGDKEALNEIIEDKNQVCNSVLINIFAQRIIKDIKQNITLINRLKLL